MTALGVRRRRWAKVRFANKVLTVDVPGKLREAYLECVDHVSPAGLVTMSAARLGSLLCKSEDTGRRHLAALVKCGLLDRDDDGGPHASARYFVVDLPEHLCPLGVRRRGSNLRDLNATPRPRSEGTKRHHPDTKYRGPDGGPVRGAAVREGERLSAPSPAPSPPATAGPTFVEYSAGESTSGLAGVRAARAALDAGDTSHRRRPPTPSQGASIIPRDWRPREHRPSTDCDRSV